ncbi:MAG TPA: hypothetical protein VE093_22655 [Polyangiaceae bacterium]|nr:hypothetical protein [Polyangiaceae bacterium]
MILSPFAHRRLHLANASTQAAIAIAIVFASPIAAAAEPEPPPETTAAEGAHADEPADTPDASPGSELINPPEASPWVEPIAPPEPFARYGARAALDVRGELRGAGSAAAVPARGVLAGLAAISAEGWCCWLFTPPPDYKGLSLFPGPANDPRRGVLANVDLAGFAGARVGENGASPSSGGGSYRVLWRVDESIRLALGVAELRQRSSHARPVSFGDRDWRAYSDLNAVGGGFAFDGMFGVEPYGVRLNSIDFDIDVLYEGQRHATTTASIGVAFVEYAGALERGRHRIERPLRVAVVDFHGAISYTPVTLPTGLPGERQALDLHIDLVDVHGISFSSPAWTHGFAVGFSSITPLYERDNRPRPAPVTDPETNTGQGEDKAPDAPEGMGPILWLDTIHHASRASFVPSWLVGGVASGERGAGVAVGAGTFHRLDPTGFASDFGGQLRAEAAYSLAPGLWGSASVTGLAAKRILVSDLPAPEGLRPPGAWLWMGRAEVNLDTELSDQLGMRLGAWIERSDRSDPIELGEVDPTVVRTAGGVSLGIHLE